jgi:hypothetical protein
MSRGFESHALRTTDRSRWGGRVTLWTALLSDPSTAEETATFLRSPWLWRVEPLDDEDGECETEESIHYRLPRLYTALAGQDASDETPPGQAELGDIPVSFRVFFAGE